MTHLFKKSYKNTRTKIPVTLYGVTGIFCAEMGLERPLRKHAGSMFLGRGRVFQNPDASGTDVDEIRIYLMLKSIGAGAFF